MIMVAWACEENEKSEVTMESWDGCRECRRKETGISYTIICLFEWSKGHRDLRIRDSKQPIDEWNTYREMKKSTPFYGVRLTCLLCSRLSLWCERTFIRGSGSSYNMTLVK